MNKNEKTSNISLLLKKIPWLEFISGALVFTSYALLRDWAKNEAYIVQLDVFPQPEAFDRDVAITVAFQKLGRWKHFNPDAYTEAIKYVDRILLLEKQLVHRNTLPKFGDREATKVNRECASLCFMKIMCSVNDSIALFQIQKLISDIEDQICQHTQYINTLCSEIHTF